MALVAWPEQPEQPLPPPPPLSSLPRLQPPTHLRTGAAALAASASGGAPAWGCWLVELLQRDGRPVMVIVALTVLFPLSLQRHVREVRGSGTAACPRNG